MKASRKPNYFIANSQVVANRIRDVYQREAVVIPPPVDTDRFFIDPCPDNFYLVVSRLVPYKRLDLAVRACTALKRRLIVIGDGRDRGRLESMAGPTVKFLGRQPDAVATAHLARCAALLFTGEEDFGIAPLEANASGRPVIAYQAGGAIETVLAGRTGIFFEEHTSGALEAAILECEQRFWDPDTLRRHAETYSREIFESRLLSFVDSVVNSTERVLEASA